MLLTNSKYTVHIFGEVPITRMPSVLVTISKFVISAPASLIPIELLLPCYRPSIDFGMLDQQLQANAVREDENIVYPETFPEIDLRQEMIDLLYGDDNSDDD